uniref:ABC1 atypical kinase-like domain-containing protein n=1 Tax=Opuntia streptacantha TaxID=393608 RepID=A0A7C9AFS0_OPUST
MATATGQPSAVGPSNFLLSLNSNYCPVHLSVVKFTRTKSSHRCSGQRRRARAVTRSALVEANKSSVPVLSDNTGRSSGISKSEVIQSTGDAARGGGNSFLAIAKSTWNRADDMQAEARAMARAASASVYSPEMLADKYGSRPLMVLHRTSEIILGLGSFAFTLWLDQRKGLLNQNKRLRATQLRQVFTGLGPTFVKIGQGLSTRPDICPPEYLEELAELQDTDCKLKEESSYFQPLWRSSWWYIEKRNAMVSFVHVYSL